MTRRLAAADDAARPGRWAAIAVAALLAVALAMLFADRPLATLVHARLHGVAAFVWLTYLPEPLVPAAGVVLVAFAVAVVAGRAPPPALLVLTRCSVSLVVATAIKDQLKYAFGRTWPETWTNHNPSFISDGAFGFTPFHGGAGWAAFPSGHTTAVCAVVAVLWVAWPRLRWLYPVPAILVVVGLIGADYHWLSDTIAGAWLGSTVGVVTALAGRRGAA